MSLRALFLAGLLIPAGTAQTPSLVIQQRIAPIFQQAREAERDGRLDDALRHYEQVIKLAPGIAEVWANKGLVLFSLDRHPEALQAFLEATRLKPTLFTPALYAGLEYLRADIPRKAVEPLRAAVRLAPQNNQAVFALARAHRQLGEHAEATELLRELVTRDPRVEEFCYELGTAYLEWSSSIARALTEDRSAYGDLLRAEFSAANGKLEVARLRYKAAITRLSGAASAEIPLDAGTLRLPPGEREKRDAVSPKSVQPGPGILDQAVSAWRDGRYSESLRIVRKALKNSPRNPRALYWLVLSSRALARESFLQAVENSPHSWRSHMLLADVAAQAGDIKAASEHHRTAVTLAPNEPKPRLAEIEHLEAIQNTTEALVRAEQAIQSFPDHAEFNLRYGHLLLNTDKAKEAVPYLERAARADLTSAPAHADLSYAYAELGELTKAIATLKPVLPQDEDGSLHYKIAAWYRATGQPELARNALATTARLKAHRVQRDQELMQEANTQRR